MTAYVIVYTVIMLLLLAATVSLCYFYVRGIKRNSSKAVKNTLTKNEKALTDSCDCNKGLAIVLVDNDTKRPVYISPNIEKFLGVSAQALFADTEAYKSVIEKKYTREFSNMLKEWDGQDVIEYEFGCAADGRFARVNAAMTESEGNQYIMLTIYDCTEHKQIVDKVQKELEAALGQAAAKLSFLSSMSHEIRTPMNGVMGMMALARMNINNPQKADNYLERAGDLSVFLLGMINDILDISKIDSGKMQLYNTTFDIMAFAEKIRNMFNGTITNKGIAFNVETVDFTARYLVGDELRLTQVVTNFLSNANKFTPAGGQISVTFKQLDIMGDSIKLLIRVRDTGKGIAPENIRKIMRPFEQEEASTAHNYGGTGLGLALCDNFVRMMGGNIVVDSTLGEGTDFSVFLTLPIAKDAEQIMSQPVVEVSKQKAIDFTFDDCRILLAEDNEVNAEIVIEILESEGAKVKHALDGQEAVEMFNAAAENAFDLVLLDIQMPRLNGRDAAREIRNSDKAYGETVPIIALSADAFVEDVKLSEEAGMDAHVSKPIDFDELRSRAGEIIAAKKLVAKSTNRKRK